LAKRRVRSRKPEELGYEEESESPGWNVHVRLHQCLCRESGRAGATHHLLGSAHRAAAVQEMVLSIFLLGFAFGPLVASPLSETFGCMRVIQSWNRLYTIFNAVCGASQSKEALIILRFISGVFASATLGVSRVAVLGMAHTNSFRLVAELSATYSDPRIAVKVSLYTVGARWPVRSSA
jgi:MFS family permease